MMVEKMAQCNFGEKNFEFMAQFRGACTSRYTRYYMVILIMGKFLSEKDLCKNMSLLDTNFIPCEYSTKCQKTYSSSQTNFDDKLRMLKK